MLLDIRQLVQEFYAMEAVSAMIQGNQYSCFQPMRHSHSRWHSDFMEFQKTYISQFAAATTITPYWSLLRNCGMGNDRHRVT